MELNPNNNKARVYSKVFQIMLILFAFLVIFILFFSFMSKDTIDYSEADFIQEKQPDDSDTVVVFETSKGVIKAVLYEDQAPKYCKYFKGLVEDGYFDGTYICSIMKTDDGLQGGFIGGSKTKEGIAGEDSDTKMTKLEVSRDLLPIKGSLCSLVKQKGIFSNAKAGSVITFVNDVVDVEELRESFSEQEDVKGLGKVTDMFTKYGGVPNFLQQYTIFGQVYDGWEVIDEISGSEIEDEDVSDDDENKSYSPKEDIMINKVYLSTYGEQKQNGYKLYDKASEDNAAGEDTKESSGENSQA